MAGRNVMAGKRFGGENKKVKLEFFKADPSKLTSSLLIF